MTLNAGIRTILAIATLGLAGYFSATVNTTGAESVNLSEAPLGGRVSL
jgi:hypothetical protein